MRRRDHFHLSNKLKRRILRKKATETEKILWTRLRRRQLGFVKFRRQHSIVPYIVDFYAPQLKLIIEIDGPSHFMPENQEYEKRRNTYLVKNCRAILRFQNSEVYENLDGVIVTIQEKIIELNSEGHC